MVERVQREVKIALAANSLAGCVLHLETVVLSCIPSSSLRKFVDLLQLLFTNHDTSPLPPS
jgi:hypothetical protein